MTLGGWLRPRRAQVAYAVLVDRAVEALGRELQSRIERALGYRPTMHSVLHVTLKLGFEAPAPEPFERHVEDIAQQTEPFTVHVQGIDFFDEGIVFLDVRRSPELDHLRRRILGDLSRRHGVEPYDLEGEAFRYHVTLAHDLTGGELSRVRDALARVEVRRDFTLEGLALLAYEGRQWVVAHRASLRAREDPAAAVEGAHALPSRSGGVEC